ncbi:MAG: formimidoylglutamate deiminase [Longimicrobiales bacterium]
MAARALRAIQPALAYVGDEFVADLVIVFDEQSGTIARVGPAHDVPADLNVERRSGCALLPGMVNAHSHAFQRVIRGWTQWRPPDEQADFWSWRESMYRAVLRLTPDDVYLVSRFCFIEMLLAGYTTVGEFHYLHCDPRGRAYEDPNELAVQVVRAAQDAGIRITVLNVAYTTGGIAEPLRPEQARFATPDLDAFLAHTDTLCAWLQGCPLARGGIAPHSIRAVPREWLRPIAEYARARELPLHMHLSEQPAEVAASVRYYGARPVELAETESVLSDGFTAVHATHLADGEVAALGRARAHVCACPTTERDLGDGIMRARDLTRAGARLCIGSDSQTTIDPWDELRSIEYHARLALLRRVVLTDARTPDRLENAPLLLRAGTTGGAGALRTGTGILAAGEPADFVLIDLEHPALAGWNKTTLGALLALSAPAAVVNDVWVGGWPRVRDRQHDALSPARHAFEQVCQRVLA